MLHDELNLLLACGVVVALWWWSVKAREAVDRIAGRMCAEHALQRLDGTVTLRRLWLTRADGRAAVARLYSFEYSISGDDRRRGDVCLINAVPRWVRLDLPGGALHIELGQGAAAA